jgi:hypothetical protein
MPAPIIAAAGAAIRAGAVAVGRGLAAAGRAIGSAVKAGAQAAGRGLRSAATGVGRSAKGLVRRTGKSAGGASKRVGSAAKDAATPKARGPGSASRNGWNYRNPNQPNMPTGPQGPTGAQVKKFLANRLKRMLLMHAWRKSRKDRKNPKTKLGKARAKLRRRRRRVRRVLVFAFLLMVVFPLVVTGVTGGQMNDAIAASQGRAGDDEFGLVSGIPYAEEFNKTAELGIDPRLVAAVAWAESSFDPDNISCKKTSSAGAKGIMQLMPDTAAALGVDPCRPPEAIHGGAQYLLEQHRKFGTWELALAAYNAGPGKVEGAGNRIPDIAETKAYVPKVMGRWDDYKTQFPGGTITGGGPPGGPLGGTARVVDSHNTATMQRVLDALVERFGRGRGIGCYRNESNLAPSERGEHGLGRACDFMMATGGQKPTEEYLDHGWAMANWLIANAEEYDVRYIIWQKRIWQNGSWRPYTRYGNSTNNTLQHYDHVHLSVN